MAEQEVNTNGGAFIEQGVDIGKGDFVGRDKIKTTNYNTHNISNVHTHSSNNLIGIIAILAIIFLGIVSIMVMRQNINYPIAQPTALATKVKTEKNLLDKASPTTSILAAANTEQPTVLSRPNTTATLNVTVNVIPSPKNNSIKQEVNPCLANIHSPTGSSVQVLEIDGSRTARIIADKKEVIITGKNNTDTGVIFGTTDLDGYEIGWIRDYNLANVSVNCPYQK